MGKRIKTEIINTVLCVLSGILSAFTLHFFVYKNGFSPSGIDGVATMLQELTGISAGLVSMAVNIPLLIIAFKFINKKYIVYTLVYTLVSSLFIIYLGNIDFPQYEAMYEKMAAAIFSGLLLGIRTGIMIRIGGSTGGIDIVAAMIQRNRTYMNIERIISVICYAIIISSYFVYGNIEAVLLSLVQMFVFERGVAFLLSDNRDAVVFHIITKDPDTVKDDIMCGLKHGATLVETKGIYTGEESFMIISIVNKRQIPQFMEILKKHKEAFVYYSDISGVLGNFRWKRDDIVK